MGNTDTHKGCLPMSQLCTRISTTWSHLSTARCHTGGDACTSLSCRTNACGPYTVTFVLSLRQPAGLQQSKKTAGRTPRPAAAWNAVNVQTQGRLVLRRGISRREKQIIEQCNYMLVQPDWVTGLAAVVVQVKTKGGTG